jgi:urease accessory protein
MATYRQTPAMLRCTQLKRRSNCSPDKADSRLSDTITLDETDRHRRRFAMTSDNGIAFLLELETTTLLQEGDLLLLDDGRRIEVRAEAEPLYEIRARNRHQLLQLSWHLGNRHLPTQIMADHLRIRQDSVIRDMLIGLGAQVTETRAGFDPESGAYADPHDHDSAS